MHKGIFSRLAKQNIRNNKSTYIPYMITCIFCIAMIYMMEFLRDCPTLDQAVRQADEVRMIVFYRRDSRRDLLYYFSDLQ